MINLLFGKKKFEKGQAVLVVLLIMSVMLTIGLSAVSRSVTDVKVSQQTQESARAFWTAQAELEKALLTQELPIPGTTDGIRYSVSKVDMGGGVSKDFVFPELINQGESAIYWLVDHNADGSYGTNFYSGDLTLYWGNPGDTDTALVVTFIYKDGTVFKSKKFAYDPIERIPDTNFDSASPGGSVLTTNFAHNSGPVPIDVPANSYFANIKLIFNSNKPQSIGVIGTVDSPPIQGSCYESTAVVDASNIVRRLRQCRTWPKTPEIFDYLLFSGGNLDR